jgi:putative addiction module CopG family antidote
MRISLTKELESLVKEKVRSGRYTDESDVVRDASPALEATLLEGIRSGHRRYNKNTLDRVRKGARPPR